MFFILYAKCAEDFAITTIFSYDENIKSSNNKGFLLQST